MEWNFEKDVLSNLITKAKMIPEATLDFLRDRSDADDYLDEYRTITLIGPRRSGHTTNVARALDDHEDAIAIVPYESQRQQLVERGARFHRVFVLDRKSDGDLLEELRDLTPGVVILDPVRGFSGSQVDRLKWLFIQKLEGRHFILALVG